MLPLVVIEVDAPVPELKLAIGHGARPSNPKPDGVRHLALEVSTAVVLREIVGVPVMPVSLRIRSCRHGEGGRLLTTVAIA